MDVAATTIVLTPGKEVEIKVSAELQRPTKSYNQLAIETR